MNTTTPEDQALQFNAPTPAPLRTGSCVLDAMLGEAGLQTGQLLHFYGGFRLVQQRYALMMARAACERGERVLFLNLGAPVEAPMLHRLGLSPFFNPDPALDLRQRYLQRFHLWVPKPVSGRSREENADDILRFIRGWSLSAAENCHRLTIFVDHLERVFEPGALDSKAPGLSRAETEAFLATLSLWLEGLSALCRETGVTLWLLHTGDEAAPPFGRGGGDRIEGWRVDVDERGELVRRERMGGNRERAGKVPSRKGLPRAPSAFQKGVTAMFCDDATTGADAQTGTDEGATANRPELFGLEVGKPGHVFSVFKFGASRFTHRVQLWRGSQRVGRIERLLVEPTYRFDDSPGLWTPRLRPPSAAPRIIWPLTWATPRIALPNYLGTTPGAGAETFQTAEMGEDTGSMWLGAKRLSLRLRK